MGLPCRCQGKWPIALFAQSQGTRKGYPYHGRGGVQARSSMVWVSLAGTLKEESGER